MPAIEPDNQGLICAFVLNPIEPRGQEAFAGGAASVERPLWLHLNLVDTRVRRWLESAGLPDDVREVFLDSTPRTHGQGLPEGVLLVLSDMHHDFKGDPEAMGALCLYVDQHRVITGRRHPLMSVDRLRRTLPANADVRTSADLLEEILQTLADSFANLVAKLGDDVDDAEDSILAGHLHDQGGKLGRMRRTLARLRRNVRANRAALASVLSHLPSWCDADFRHRLHQAVERVDAVGQDIELVQERTRLLQEEIGGRLGEATNRNLFVLSMMTATLLPVTLITGIFGMNVGGLPWLDSSSGFAWVTGIMVTAVILVLLLLRRRRIF